MTEIDKLKKKIEEAKQEEDYLVSDNSKGKKSYTVRSKNLKESLRNAISTQK